MFERAVIKMHTNFAVTLKDNRYPCWQRLKNLNHQFWNQSKFSLTPHEMCWLLATIHFPQNISQTFDDCTDLSVKNVNLNYFYANLNVFVWKLRCFEIEYHFTINTEWNAKSKRASRLQSHSIIWPEVNSSRCDWLSI